MSESPVCGLAPETQQWTAGGIWHCKERTRRPGVQERTLLLGEETVMVGCVPCAHSLHTGFFGLGLRALRSFTQRLTTAALRGF